MKKCYLLALSSLLGLLASYATIAQNEEFKSAPAFTGDELISLPRDGWITNGGNVYNQRYSPLDQINRDNVSGLKAVWRARLDGSGAGPMHSGEALGDCKVFVGKLVALNQESGRPVWEVQAEQILDLGAYVSSLAEQLAT